MVTQQLKLDLKCRHLFRTITFQDGRKVGICRDCGDIKSDYIEVEDRVFHLTRNRKPARGLSLETFHSNNQGFQVQGTYHDENGRLYTFEDTRGIYNDRY